MSIRYIISYLVILYSKPTTITTTIINDMKLYKYIDNDDLSDSSYVVEFSEGKVGYYFDFVPNSYYYEYYGNRFTYLKTNSLHDECCECIFEGTQSEIDEYLKLLSITHELEA